MDDLISYHEFWPAPMRALAQVSEWMDWMQPLSYCMLAVAVVGLVLRLLDMALLLLKEFHATTAKKTINVRISASPLLSNSRQH